MEIVSTTTEDERCALQWRFTGTFAGPGSLQRDRADRTPVELEGVDVLTVRDGLIQSNDAFTDTMAVPRQIGMMPPLGSTRRAADDGRVQRQDARERRADGRGEAKLVAEGVWVVQGQPGRCNVYLIENGEGGRDACSTRARAR